MAKKHSKKSGPLLKLIAGVALITAVFLTVMISQNQQNTKQEASVSGAIGTYCTSDTNCSTGLSCLSYKCSSSESSVLSGVYQKDGDYLCQRCSASNKYCFAVWHEGDANCDRNNVISETSYEVDCNCTSGADEGICPNEKSTKSCKK